MKRAAPLFDATIPENYDTYLGPFLFRFYAADLAQRLSVDPRASILETACGTGISTELMRRSVDGSVQIVATDLSEPMLDVARERRADLANVRFRQADAAELPFRDRTFDALVSQFGLMFMPDKLRVLREAHRVLQPGGRLAFNVWDDLASNPYVQVAQDAIATFFDTAPPQFLYLPWSYHEHEPIKELLRSAGFIRTELHTVSHVAQLPTARDVARGFVRGNPTINDVRERARAPVGEVVDAVAEALGAAFGAAPFRAPMRAIVVTAERPAS